MNFYNYMQFNDRVIHVSLRFRYCEYKGVESYSFISVNCFIFLY